MKLFRNSSILFYDLDTEGIKEMSKELAPENKYPYTKSTDEGPLLLIGMDYDVVEDMNNGEESLRTMKRDFFDLFLYVEEGELLDSYSQSSYFNSDGLIYLQLKQKNNSYQFFAVDNELELVKENHFFHNQNDFEAMMNSIPLFLSKHNLPSYTKVNVLYMP